MRIRTLGIVFTVGLLIFSMPSVRRLLFMAAAPVLLPPIISNVEDVRRSSYDFLWHCHYHDWSNAASLLTPQHNALQDQQRIWQQWQSIEQKYGKRDNHLHQMVVEGWNQIGNTNINWAPHPHCDIQYKIYGSNSTSLVLHMVRQNGKWLVDNFTVAL